MSNQKHTWPIECIIQDELFDDTDNRELAYETKQANAREHTNRTHVPSYRRSLVDLFEGRT